MFVKCKLVRVVTVCTTLFLLGFLMIPPTAWAATDCIDFETLPDGTPTTDQMEITNQYSNPPPPATYTGVTFSLSNGQNPRIAKVGSPVTAFQGPIDTDDPECEVDTTRDDMPRTADQDIVMCSFLTDDTTLVLGFPPDLIVNYDDPVTEAGGLLLDIDLTEKWEITAYLNSVQVGPTLLLTEVDANNEDGVAVVWTMSVDDGFDRLVFHYADPTPKVVGLAFDNFYTSSLPPSGDIPTLTEWGMIIFCVLLFGWMAWMIVKRRKAATINI